MPRRYLITSARLSPHLRAATAVGGVEGNQQDLPRHERKEKTRPLKGRVGLDTTVALSASLRNDPNVGVNLPNLS